MSTGEEPESQGASPPDGGGAETGDASEPTAAAAGGDRSAEGSQPDGGTSPAAVGQGPQQQDDSPLSRASGGDADELDDTGAAGADVARQAQQLAANSGIITGGAGAVAVQVRTTVLNGPAREVTVLRTPMRHRDVLAIKDIYHPVPDFPSISLKLGTGHLLVLLGLEGLGRRTTAVRALHEVGANRIESLDIDPEIPLRDIHDGKLLAAGTGYLLHHETGLTPSALESLAGLARDSRAYLVIICNADRPLRSDYLVEHPRPDSLGVVLKHLAAGLDGHDCRHCPPGFSVAEHLRRRTAELTDNPPPPYARMRDLADLARNLVENVHSERSLEEIMKRDRASLREIAGRALRDRPEDVPVEDFPTRRSLRLSYAVFDGFPLTDVADAAALLTHHILPELETRQNQPDHILFGEPASDAVLAEMRAGDSAAEIFPKRARLIDRTLTILMLDVAWNDFPDSHRALVRWLDELVKSARIAVWVRAAQIAGVLATLDFERIFATLIRPWAEGALSHRLAAAICVQTALDLDPRLLRRVRRQIEDWAQSSRARLQDTAVRMLTGQLGVSEPAFALGVLRKLAEKPTLSGSNSIAMAMGALFSAGNSREVLDELITWVDGTNPHCRRHAVRVLLAVSRLKEASAGAERDVAEGPLAPLVNEAEERISVIARLWRGAVMDPRTARTAWEPLRRTLMAADGDEALEKFAVDLARAVFTDVAQERALFHLRLWLIRHPDSPTLKSIYAQLTAPHPGGTK